MPPKAKRSTVVRPPDTPVLIRKPSVQSLMDFGGGSNADDVASVCTIGGTRKRSNGGYYVKKRTANPVELDAEDDKVSLLAELEKQSNMVRATLILLRSGELMNLYEKRYGKKRQSGCKSMEEVPWNPRGQWTKWRDLGPRFMIQECLKYEGVGNIMDNCKVADKNIVKKMFAYMHKVSLVQDLPAGFHQRGCTESYLAKIRSENVEAIDLMVNSVEENGSIPWQGIGIMQIKHVVNASAEVDNGVWLTRRYPPGPKAHMLSFDVGIKS